MAEKGPVTSWMFCRAHYSEQSVIINHFFKHISFRVLGCSLTLTGIQLCGEALCILKHTVWAAISKTREEWMTVFWGETHALGAHLLHCVWAPLLVGCCLMATRALSASLHSPLSRAVKRSGKSPSACTVSFGRLSVPHHCQCFWWAPYRVNKWCTYTSRGQVLLNGFLGL